MPGTFHPILPLHTDLCTLSGFMCSFFYSRLQMVMEKCLMITEKQPMNPGNLGFADRLFETEIYLEIR